MGVRSWAGATIARTSGFVKMTNGDAGVGVMQQIASGETLKRVLAG